MMAESFLNTLKMHKCCKLSPIDVIAHILDLFGKRLDNELVRGFDAFLPMEYRISERSSWRLDDGDTDIKDTNNNMKDTLCPECCFFGASIYLSATVANSSPFLDGLSGGVKTYVAVMVRFVDSWHVISKLELLHLLLLGRFCWI